MATMTTSVEIQFMWLPGESFSVGETADGKSLLPIHAHTVVASILSLISIVSLSWAFGICFYQFYNITFYICAYLLIVCS